MCRISPVNTQRGHQAISRAKVLGQFPTLPGPWRGIRREVRGDRFRCGTIISGRRGGRGRIRNVASVLSQLRPCQLVLASRASHRSVGGRRHCWHVLLATATPHGCCSHCFCCPPSKVKHGRSSANIVAPCVKLYRFHKILPLRGVCRLAGRHCQCRTTARFRILL